MIYVDLNPIRAQLVEKPEERKFISVYERIEHLKSNKDQAGILPLSNNQIWLGPIEDEAPNNRLGILSMSLRDYLDLLDWTGRQIKEGKRGVIPDHLKPILERLKINDEKWIDTVHIFGRKFRRAAVSFQSMSQAAKKLGLRWLRGQRAGREAFSVA